MLNRLWGGKQSKWKRSEYSVLVAIVAIVANFDESNATL